MTHEPQAGDWFKSSYSNNVGGECVEGARIGARAMAVRDSKDPSRGLFVAPAASWTALTDALKSAAG